MAFEAAGLPLRIMGARKEYDWGSITLIPDCLGQRADGNPFAELWLGTHPSGCSIAQTDSGDEPLSALISDAPEAMLGTEVAERFGNRLPFLMKVLGIARALSVQAHPTLQQAQEGFAREEAAGIATDDARRVYVDAFDKPELICAVSNVQALCGWRQINEVRALCRSISRNVDFSGEPGHAFLSLLGQNDQQRAEVLAAARREVQQHPDDPIWQTVGKLSEQRPGDVTAVAPLFMNLVSLRPGQALFLDAGIVHAYLSGLGVEVMGASDNVVRAGLTSKHIDLPELGRVMDPRHTPAVAIEPVSISTGWSKWPAPSPYFQLMYRSENSPSSAINGPAVMLCTAGTAHVTGPNGSVELSKGEAGFLPAGDFEVNGGAVFACAPGERFVAKS